jgi:putative acetyltransferase
VTGGATVRFRYAVYDDCPAIARLHRLSMFTAMPFLPRLHSPEEDPGFYRDQIFPVNRIYLVEAEQLLGFCAFDDGWINQLYIHPDCQRQGIGSVLI